MKIIATAIYQVDFNSVEPWTWDVRCPRDRILFRATPPILHESVLLRDAEGNECWAWITAITERLLHFRLDLSTWRDERTPATA